MFYTFKQGRRYPASRQAVMFIRAGTYAISLRIWFGALQGRVSQEDGGVASTTVHVGPKWRKQGVP